MKLAEVFSQLTYGELSQVSIGGVANGEITEENYRGIVNHINLGLTAIYKRFNLKENQLVLELQAGETLYQLNSRYAVNNKRSKEDVRFIIDTPLNPFKDDILKIEWVKTKAGNGLSLNTGSHDYVCYTPSMTFLRVPDALIEQPSDTPEYLKGVGELVVGYRANHVKLDPDVGSFVPDQIELELPDAYLNALCLFVASRVYNPIGLVNEFNAGNNFAAKFEQECVRLEFENVQVDKGNPQDKIKRGGWL